MSKMNTKRGQVMTETWITLPIGRRLLDLALLSHITLLIISGLFFVIALSHTIQNAIPVLCILLLTILLWVIRFRLSDERVSFEARRIYILEWIIAGSIIIIFSILVLIFYPGSW